MLSRSEIVVHRNACLFEACATDTQGGVLFMRGGQVTAEMATAVLLLTLGTQWCAPVICPPHILGPVIGFARAATSVSVLPAVHTWPCVLLLPLRRGSPLLSTTEVTLVFAFVAMAAQRRVLSRCPFIMVVVMISW